MKVVCEQHRDGVPDADPPIVIPALEGAKFHERWPDEEGEQESAALTLERKLAGAENRGWSVERRSVGEFHAWKLYSGGEGTLDRPHRKDRYFRIVR